MPPPHELKAERIRRHVETALGGATKAIVRWDAGPRSLDAAIPGRDLVAMDLLVHGASSSAVCVALLFARDVVWSRAVERDGVRTTVAFDSTE